MQLEALVGNSTNPVSYRYPVLLKPVTGANAETILVNPDPAVLRTMIKDAQAMVAGGIKAITTSCGFNAIFQRELVAALPVPVFTSSLLQVAWIRQMMPLDGEIAVLTANAGALRAEHLRAVGILNTEGLHILGLERCSEWQCIFDQPHEAIDLQKIEDEVLGVVAAALKVHPKIRAFVLECTDLPPYSEAIRQSSGLPVFDFITMINYLHSSLG
jgi:hypothetical protein